MGNTYYVDPARANNGDGSSWAAAAGAGQPGAFNTIQSGFDTAVAGDVVYCRGTETRAAQIDVDTNSGTNAGGFIKFIGCNAAGNRDGTRFVIQGDGANSCALIYKTGAMNMIWLENIELKSAYGASGIGLSCDTSIGNGWVLINVSIHNCASYGIYNIRYFNWFRAFLCCIYGNGNSGVYSTTGGRLMFAFSSFHDNTGDGVEALDVLCVGCLSYDNSDFGFANYTSASTTNLTLINCVSEGNDDAGVVNVAGTSDWVSTIALGTRITNHSGAGDIGINANSDPILTGWCYFEDNDGDNIQNATLAEVIPNADGTTTNIEDQANTNEGYTSLADGSEDFNLRSDASLRRTAITVPLT